MGSSQIKFEEGEVRSNSLNQEPLIGVEEPPLRGRHGSRLVVNNTNYTEYLLLPFRRAVLSYNFYFLNLRAIRGFHLNIAWIGCSNKANWLNEPNCFKKILLS